MRLPELDPTIADSTIADPTVADSTIADPTVADPTVADPTVADPTGIAPIGGRAAHVRWSAAWVIGPAAGGCTVLTPGVYRVGRSSHAEVRSLDPSLALFHAHLEIGDDGSVHVVQLAGRSPGHRSSSWREVAGADGASAWLHLPAEVGVGWIDLGGSRLELSRLDPSDLDAVAATRRAASSASGTTVVRRPPRAVPVWRPVPIVVPEVHTAATTPWVGLVPTLLGLVGAVVVALILRQPMFLLLGLVGGLVAAGGWGAQRWTDGRRRRASGRSHRDAMAHFAIAVGVQRAEHLVHHQRFVGTLEVAMGDVLGQRAGLWARRHGDRDGFVVSAGRGDVRWEPHLAPHASMPDACWAVIERAGIHAEASIPVDLGPRASVAVCGDDRLAVVRSLVVQLAARAGPSDWQLLVVSDDPATWAWAAGLPHRLGADPTGSTAVSAVAPDGAVDGATAAALCRDAEHWRGRHTVIVTDDWAALSMRTSAVRRLMAMEPNPAVVVVCPSTLDAPACCTAVLDCGRDGRGRWLHDARQGSLAQPIRTAGLHARDALVVVGHLGRCTDPEDLSHGGGMPRTVSLLALLSATGGVPTAASIAGSWAAGGSDVSPATPIGVAVDGTVDIDLVRDGPHALLAGTTGSGKSELLRALVLGLAMRSSPEQITFVLVDYKGGATFDSCLRLPHVVGLVTDLDERLADRALRSLRAELHHRERVLRSAGVADLTALRRAAGAPVLPRLVVVIDEFAALAVEHPAFLHSLVDVAQRGRSLGVHLLLATQRPNGVISDDIRANTNLRIALRLHDTADAIDVVGDAAPAGLARDLPGRVVMRLGPAELVEFQAGHLGVRGADRRSETELLVDAIVEAASTLSLDPPRRPWTAPLPSVLDRAPDDDPSAAVGIVDLPDRQSQRPLRWHPDSGHLLVVGARGAGVTSTLRTVASIVARHHRLDLYVVDALGDRAWDEVEAVPTCAGVVRLHERERLIRLLRRLDPARSTRHDLPSIVVIDGLAALRAELDTADRSDEHEMLGRILSAGGPSAVALAIGAADTTSLPASVIARCSHRWLLHVNDPHEAVALGLPAGRVPPDVPGRALVLGSAEDPTGAVDAQIVRPETITTDTPRSSSSAATDLDVLPDLVDARSLRDGRSAAGATDEWRCPLGVAFDTLTVDELVVPDGEHVLVIGPPRSGRSAVLVRILRAWAAHGTTGGGANGGARWVGVLAPRRSPLPTHAVAIARDGSAEVHVAVDVLDLLAHVPSTRPALVLIDDAELVDDVDGRLAALVASRRPDLAVVAAGRAEGLRAAYGHWTGTVRRSRRGVIMSGSHEHDGDLLGVTLPRRGPLSPRPGLAHVVEDGATRLVQCAIDPPPGDVEDAATRRTTRRAGAARRAADLVAVS